MAKRKSKNKNKSGWFILERVHPIRKKSMHIAVHFRDGREVSHRWLYPEKKQTLWGKILDMKSDSEVVLTSPTPRNKTYHKKYPSQLDFEGIDTEMIGQKTYKDLLIKFSKTKEYKKRYKKKK